MVPSIVFHKKSEISLIRANHSRRGDLHTIPPYVDAHPIRGPRENYAISQIEAAKPRLFQERSCDEAATHQLRAGAKSITLLILYIYVLFRVRPIRVRPDTLSSDLKHITHTRICTLIIRARSHANDMYHLFVYLNKYADLITRTKNGWLNLLN